MMALAAIAACCTIAIASLFFFKDTRKLTRFIAEFWPDECPCEWKARGWRVEILEDGNYVMAYDLDQLQPKPGSERRSADGCHTGASE